MIFVSAFVGCDAANALAGCKQAGCGLDVGFVAIQKVKILCLLFFLSSYFFPQSETSFTGYILFNFAANDHGVLGRSLQETWW